MNVHGRQAFRQLRMQGHEGAEGGGNLWTHFFHGLQIALGHTPETFEAGEGLGQQLGRLGADHGNSQGVQPASEGFGAREMKFRHDVLGTLFGHAIQIDKKGQSLGRIL